MIDRQDVGLRFLSLVEKTAAGKVGIGRGFCV